MTKLAALVNIPAIELLGLRPGEMLDCIRWRLEPWGCGTTTFCRACGAVRTILNSQQRDVPDVQECHILCNDRGEEAALDLRIWATPITVAGFQNPVQRQGRFAESALQDHPHGDGIINDQYI